MGRQDLAYIDLLGIGRVKNAVRDKLTQCILVSLLQLAAATGCEMSAGRIDMMRSRRQRAIS